jgi:hypothetical protein
MLRNPALAFLSNGLSNEPSFRSGMLGIITTPTNIDCEALVFLRVKGNAVIRTAEYLDDNGRWSVFRQPAKADGQQVRAVRPADRAGARRADQVLAERI